MLRNPLVALVTAGRPCFAAYLSGFTDHSRSGRWRLHTDHPAIKLGGGRRPTEFTLQPEGSRAGFQALQAVLVTLWEAERLNRRFSR